MPKRIEEIYARDLYKKLKGRFNEKSNSILSKLWINKQRSEVKIKVEGAGVHWNCIIGNKNRQIKIYCVDIDRLDVEYKGAEFIVDYYEFDEYFKSGRTFSEEKVIQSIDDWLADIQKEKVYTKYEFIDGRRKRLKESLNKINIYAPKLKECCSKYSVAKESFSERIWIELNERSCEGYFWGYEEFPRFIFKWDETNIFEHSDKDYELIANLINDWIVNSSMPSQMDKKYKEVDFGKLGFYYENGKGIEGEFILSWDSIEQFYGELSDEWHPFKKDALKLIKEMRIEGLDKELRAGQSLFFFMLSRARRHGLGNTHPYLHIAFIGENRMRINSNLNKDRKDVECEVKYTGYIKELVEKLLGEEIK